MTECKARGYEVSRPLSVEYAWTMKSHCPRIWCLTSTVVWEKVLLYLLLLSSYGNTVGYDVSRPESEDFFTKFTSFTEGEVWI